MKKIWLVIILILSFLSRGNCQTNVYHSFPDSAMWRVDYDVHNPFQFFYYYDSYFHYYVSGDTIINAKTYKKIYRSYLFTTHINVHPLWPVPQSKPPCYLGALRDDPVADKTFFVYEGTNTDSLLFDYNLLPGDTVKGIPGQFYSFPKTVNSVDSVMVDGSYRRRWNLDSCYTIGNYYFLPYIIEGIGSSSGLIDGICDYAMDFTDRYLVCVKNGSTTLFESGYNSEMGCQPIIESLPEPDNELELLAFPNPFSQTTTIQSDVVLKDAVLTIFDAAGNRVRIIESISGQTILIERNNLPCGIYFCQLIQDNCVIAYKKIVVADY
ncbi:MAG: hypothetical protein CVU11_06355 [Bacteroidetes bacterium HGW-Bacteroidetes-6]|jgi:hypothetical protein|nr:MAG: hypothetical protein CVU11_06355 [Bacteroidetes bacterium HGW-Bacteroidetes-6]